MSFPASATEPRLDSRIRDLVAAGSVEISPRELHRAKDVGTLLPAGSCVYIPSLSGLPLARTLEAIAAIRDAGLDPVPHVSARRILNRDEFRDFAYTADIFYAVVRREPEIRVQAVTDIVAIEHVRIHAAMKQVALD